MQAITAERTWARNAWERSLIAAQAQRASALTGSERLDESRSRLNRMYARLNQSAERVGRGEQRHAPTPRAT